MSTTHEILGADFPPFFDGPAASYADVHVDFSDTWTDPHPAAITPAHRGNVFF